MLQVSSSLTLSWVDLICFHSDVCCLNFLGEPAPWAGLGVHLFPRHLLLYKCRWLSSCQVAPDPWSRLLYSPAIFSSAFFSSVFRLMRSLISWLGLTVFPFRKTKQKTLPWNGCLWPSARGREKTFPDPGAPPWGTPGCWSSPAKFSLTFRK